MGVFFLGCVLLGFLHNPSPTTSTCGSAKEIDKLLCGPDYNSTDEDSVCTVSGTVLLKPDWTKCKLEGNGSFVLSPGAFLGCANYSSICATDRTSEGCRYFAVCELHLSFSQRVTLGVGSVLNAGTAFLESTNGEVIIEPGATVDTSGRGFCGVTAAAQGEHATPSWLVARMGKGSGGAGHGGSGGKCEAEGGRPSENEPGLSFGDATIPLSMEAHDKQYMLKNPPDLLDLYGSGTYLGTKGAAMWTSKSQCCGGGVVVINARKGVQVDGLLSADAQLQCLLSPPPDSVLPQCDSRYTVHDCFGIGEPVDDGGASVPDVSACPLTRPASALCCHSAALLPPVLPRPFTRTMRRTRRCDARGAPSRAPHKTSPCASSAPLTRGRSHARAPSARAGGASGGTIVVTSPMPLRGNGTVSAQGGQGGAYVDPLKLSWAAAGGSGGRVQLPDLNSDVKPIVQGGLNSEGHCYLGAECECGPAGSLLIGGDYPANGSSTCNLDGDNPCVLLVDNGGYETSAASYVSGHSLQKPELAFLRLDELRVSNGATLEAHCEGGSVCVRNITASSAVLLSANARILLKHDQSIIVDRLELDQAAQIVGAVVSGRRRRAADSSGGSVNVNGGNAPFRPPSNTLIVGSLLLDTTSRIQGFGQISISESASIDGRIEMLSDGDSLAISMEPAASLSLHALGSISAPSLVVEGGKVSVMGHIVATRSIKAHCGRFIFDCAANASFVIDEGCDYSLYMSVEQLTVEGDGAIASAAMRLCVSSRVLMKDSGSITASSLGHQRGEGPGAGGVYSPTGARAVTGAVTGAGSGGSHGGKGGNSGCYHNVAGMDGKEAYDEPMLPGYMGSGGGGSKGGQGGGIIHLHVGGQGLVMAQHSAIAADGVDAGNPQSRQASRRNRSKDEIDDKEEEGEEGEEDEEEGEEEEGGSGGGAGGTIYLQVGNLSMTDNTMVHANGGSGAPGGGGGGGGGRLHLELLPGMDRWPHELDSSSLDYL